MCFSHTHTHADADADPDVFVLAAVIVPLACAGLAVLALVCCIRSVFFVCFFLNLTSFVSSFATDIHFYFCRNKDYIFPPIPKPRDLLSDISDNNNKVIVATFHRSDRGVLARLT